MLTKSLNALNARRKNPSESDKGFTLIELLVVVIIIGVLAAIAIPVYLGVQSNAKDSAIKADLTNLKTAAIAFQTSSASQALPTAITDLDSTVTIDAGNYTTTPKYTPVITTNPATFTFCGVGSNGNAWIVTDSTSPQPTADAKTCP